MLAARFRARLPPDTWVADVSTAIPDATFRLLAGVRREGTAVELGEVVAPDPTAAGEAMRAHTAISRFERLEATEERALARYETTDTHLYEFLASSSVPVSYPVVAADGWYEFDLTGTREQFDRLRAALEATGRPFELLSVVGDDEGTGLLTDRQRTVLDAALRRGYFEVPRECTLAELAAALDVDASAASRTLRRGQARVLRWYLTSTVQTGGRPREP